MKYLITGGCGFIGSHLSERLIRDGHDVVALDDLSTGRYDNVARLDGNAKFQMLIGSVLDSSLVEDLVRQCDAVFHLASAVGVRLIMERPVQTIETIFQGTDVVLRFASRYRKPTLITSTSEVYGKSTDIPFHEDGDRLEGPTNMHRWAYACAKSLDEFLALAHWKQSRLPVVVTRLFNTVGPRQTGQYGMVVPNFVQKALADEPIVVHGDGKQSRCFAHVLDVVEGLIGLLPQRAAHGEVVNLGSNEEVSILELAERVRRATDSKSEIRHVPYADVYGDGFEDMRRRVPSIEKAKRILGWSPRKSLDDVLRDVISYYRDRPGG
jgi:UDP-glucose 4-epimerase